jgi:hypothetical protein
MTAENPINLQNASLASPVPAANRGQQDSPETSTADTAASCAPVSKAKFFTYSRLPTLGRRSNS